MMTDYTTLITRLRSTESRSKRELLDSAADTIEALIAELRSIGDCTTCKHMGEENCEYECVKCKEKCVCYRCMDGSLHEWRGVQHD